MAAGAASGGLSLTGWIAGGCIAAAVGVGGLYYAGVFSPDPVPEAPVETAALTPDAVATPTSDPVPAPTAPQSTDQKSEQDTASTPVPQDSSSVEPAPEDQPSNTPEMQAVESAPQVDPADAQPELLAPRFDVVRVDPEGNTVIAGTGSPGSRITIFLDDTEQVSAQVDRAGAFVSLLSIPPSNTARVLTLLAELNGEQRASDDQIILAPSPVAEPESEVQVAQAEPVPETSTTASEPEPVTETQVVQAETEEATAVISNTVAPTADVVEAVEIVTADTVVAKVEQAVTQNQTSEAALPPSDAVAEAAQTSEPVTVVATDTAAEASPDEPVATVEVESVAEVVATSQEAPQTTTDTATTTQAQGSVQIATADTSPEPAPISEPTAVKSEEPAPEPATASAPEPTPEPTPEPATEESTPVPTTAVATADTDASTTEPTIDSAAAPTQSTGPEPAPPAPVIVLRAGKDGVEVLQSAAPAPEMVQKIALDTISYSDEGDVQLSGRAQGQSVVRVYLDNNAVADLQADQSGRWSGRIEGIEPGIYTLRLDELGITGDVLSRLETPFKREAPEVLAPPQAPDGDALTKTPPIRAVTVQRGDTLWAISRERYGDGVLYVRVFEANRGHIRNPDLIYPGQVFSLPD